MSQTNSSTTPLSSIWLTICNHTWLPVRNYFYTRICLPIRRKHRRAYVQKRDEALKRMIHIAISFNETTGRTSFILKVHNIAIDSLPDATDENAVRNLVSHCNYLRTLNRHNINYAKL